MSPDNAAEFPNKPPGIDFAKVAQEFAAKENGSGGISETFIGEIAKGMHETDTRLAGSKGELILLQYHSDERIVYAVGKTNGEGIKISQDTETGANQIEFGADAVVMETIIDDDGTEDTLTRREALTIPEGVSLEMFTPSGRVRYLLIGDDDIRRKVRVGGANQVGEIAYRMELAGVTTETFFKEYFKIPESSSESEKQRIASEIIYAVHDHRRMYAGSLEKPAENAAHEEAVDRAVNVQPITFEKGKILIGDKDSQIDLGSNMNPDVVSLEQMTQRIANAHAAHQKPYYISWIGGSVLREVTINGVEIGYTSHGTVEDIDGEVIGTYTRLNEPGGDEQEMIVFMNRKE